MDYRGLLSASDFALYAKLPSLRKQLSEREGVPADAHETIDDQWCAKMVVRQYFASIDHKVLKEQIERKFKSPRLLTLIHRMIDAHCDGPGRGLPIGALTSQCFANFYLGRLD